MEIGTADVFLIWDYRGPFPVPNHVLDLTDILSNLKSMVKLVEHELSRANVTLLSSCTWTID